MRKAAPSFGETFTRPSAAAEAAKKMRCCRINLWWFGSMLWNCFAMDIPVSSLRSAVPFQGLTRSQSVDGIGGSSASGRKCGCKKSHQHHDHDPCSIDQWIGCAHIEQESTDEPRNGQRTEHAESASKERKLCARNNHQPGNARARSAERHADGNLLRA